MFEGLYVANISKTLLFEYLADLDLPKYKVIRTKIQIIEDRNTELPPFIEISKDRYVCYKSTKNLVIYLLFNTTSNINPYGYPVFIEKVIEVMVEYFGLPLTASKIENNRDKLTLIMNEMIDNGIPYVTDFNKIRELVPHTTLLSRLLNTTNLTAGGTDKPSNAFAKSTLDTEGDAQSVPWRRSNVKYTNNEMYVDVNECISLILKPVPLQGSKALSFSRNFDSAFYSTSALKTSTRLASITGIINGHISFLSHLSGVPLLQMILQLNRVPIDSPRFHECINIDRWMDNPGSLSFIPPDGRSTLMRYHIDINQISKNEQQSYFGLIDVDLQVGLGMNLNEFEATVFVKSQPGVSKIDNLIIQVVCNGEHDNNKDVGPDSVSNIRASRATHGDFLYKGGGIGEWNLNGISTGIQAVLHGTLMASNFDDGNDVFRDDGESYSGSDLIEGVSRTKGTESSKQLKPTYLKIDYSHKGCVPSGIKVDSLKVVSAKGMGDTVKPYKGVKYLTHTGDLVIRS